MKSLRIDGNNGEGRLMSRDDNTRLLYVDYYKAISIILVVLAHLSPANTGLKTWISSFNMPAFFFASGLFLKSDQDQTIGETWRFIRKRLQGLMIPFFFWGIIYAPFSFTNLAELTYGSHVMLKRAETLTYLWFLPTLFMSLLFFAAARFVLKKFFILPAKLALVAASFLIAWLLPASKIGYPWCFDVAFSAFGFLLLGNISLPMIKAIRGFCKNQKAGIAIFGLATAVSFVGTLSYRLNLANLAERVLMAEAKYGSMPLFLLTALSGILFTMAVSLLLDSIFAPTGRVSRALTYVGKNTLAIFVVQKPFILILRKVFSIVPVPDVMALIVSCIGTVFACCLTAVCLHKILPVSLGRLLPPSDN